MFYIFVTIFIIMDNSIKLGKWYSEIENIVYDSFIKDVLSSGAKRVRAGTGPEEKFDVFHYNSCTLDVCYSQRKNLSLHLFGEGEIVNETIDSLDKKVLEYNKKYSNGFS